MKREAGAPARGGVRPSLHFSPCLPEVCPLSWFLGLTFLLCPSVNWWMASLQPPGHLHCNLCSLCCPFFFSPCCLCPPSCAPSPSCSPSPPLPPFLALLPFGAPPPLPPSPTLPPSPSPASPSPALLVSAVALVVVVAAAGGGAGAAEAEVAGSKAMLPEGSQSGPEPEVEGGAETAGNELPLGVRAGLGLWAGLRGWGQSLAVGVEPHLQSQGAPSGPGRSSTWGLDRESPGGWGVL